MLRHHALADASARASVPVRLLYSARTWDDIIYREELESPSRGRRSASREPEKLEFGLP
jgi:ferredoxin-NADP reductase